MGSTVPDRKFLPDLVDCRTHAENTRMLIEAIPALFLKLTAGRYGSKPALGFLAFVATVCGYLVVPITFPNISHVLGEVKVFVRDRVASGGSFA